MRFLAALFVVSSLCPAQQAPVVGKKPFDVKALLQVARVGEPQISPDGKWVVYSVQTVNTEANTKPRHIFLASTQDGQPPRQLTRDGSNNERPRWSPDSDRIAFVSNRGGSSQIWTMNREGGDLKQITNLSTEASGVSYSPNGKFFVFTSDVYPECPDDACNKTKIDQENASKLKARSYTSLLYRHWTAWEGARKSHLMMVAENGGPVKDLTPGTRRVPPFSLGGPDDYAIAPDGKEVCFVMNPDMDLATSTNAELYAVPVEGGDPKRITVNGGADNSPAYSPDGRWLAYRAQIRAGYESDRWRLMVLERSSGRMTALTDGMDRNVNGLAWSTDSKRVFFTTEDRGRSALQAVPATGGAARVLINGSGHLDDVQLSSDGKTVVYSEQTGSKPLEIYVVPSSGGMAKALTKANDALFTEYSVSPFEEFWVKGAEDARVHSFLLKPPNFDSRRKYPALILIHGGPQGAWGESWSYRWNPQVFAAAGFVVAMPNPRGSTGYGQKFTDDINSDWGGKVYDDLMAVVDHVAALPYVDGDRMAAAGGSYGGYMVNWMLGHTTRFKAFVSHAGVFDLRSMAGETEELWFPAWEFRGMPWDNPEVYQRWSPSYFVNEFKTPTLVIHGELDYRVPVGQGLQLFTGLQMKKVPSKLLLFPDEGHWILKPQNSVLWYNQFLDWITEWTRKTQ